MKKTPLHPEHERLGAKMVDFAGFEMPMHYGSQINEHHRVRDAAGMFDVSHMLAVDLNGVGAGKFLRYALANDIAKINDGAALYGTMLNEAGRVLDDLITYRLDENHYRLVINAAGAQQNLAWLEKSAKGFSLTIEPRRDLAIIAAQGPEARAKVFQAIGGTEAMCEELKPFQARNVGSLFIARTGYTGEDGFEIILPHKAAIFTWRQLLDAGVEPCGLGARDTLRLEAGMLLYGADMNTETSPLEALSWTVDFKDKTRDFIGKNALLAEQKTGIKTMLVGLVLQQPGMLRDHQTVRTNTGEGVITSGGFSPTMKRAIALARVPKGSIGGGEISVRGRVLSAKIVKPPFVRRGKILIEDE